MPSPTGPAEGRLENNLRRVESKLFRPGGGTFSSVDRTSLVADYVGNPIIQAVQELGRCGRIVCDLVSGRWRRRWRWRCRLRCRAPTRRSRTSCSSRARPSISISASRAAAATTSTRGSSRRFIGKHIPGNPTVVPQTMTGAGSFQLANYLFASAPKDGTAMGTITQTVALEEALHSPGVRYKAAEFNWIGRATAHSRDRARRQGRQGQDHCGGAAIRDPGRRHRLGLTVGRLSQADERAGRHQVQDHLGISGLRPRP